MTDFLAQFTQFHFLRPDWFWLIIPLIIFWLLKRKMATTTHWHQVIPPHLANAMLGNNKQNKVKQKSGYLPFIWLLSIIALAGPTWQKIEKPVFQVKRASVLVLDMSMSMRATDVKPNRLSKARYKAIDLANAITDGEVALVAYAGDAFTISPLTPDTRNITALLPSLKPEIMPTQGSYPLSGLTKASELLQQAGYPTGDIFWITDGVDSDDVAELTSFVKSTPYRVNIMTVGTSEGAPIKMLDGSLLKDHLGSIVIPKLNNRDLISVSNLSNGIFVNATASDADIRTLLAANVTLPQANQPESETEQQNESSVTGDDWQEFGPYILLVVLPLFSLYFRKGASIALLLILPFTFGQNQAIAANSTPSNTNSITTTSSTENPTLATANQAPALNTVNSWSDFVFKTPDQVAKQQFESEQYAQAQQTFEHPQWKGAAAYKAGDYESALKYFQQDTSAQGLYNQGNALANLGQIDQAIKAYDAALAINPDDQKSKANKALLEQLKQQQDNQQQQQSDQQQSDSNQEQDSKEDQSPSDSNSSQSENSDSENANSEQNSDDSKQPQSGEQQQSDQQSSPSESQPEPSESESQPTPEQQPGENENQSSEQQQASQQPKDEQSQSEPTAGSKAQEQQDMQSKEQQQKLQQLLRKVSDDPAVLLRNKMILESKKRQQTNRLPKGATKSW